MGKKPTKTERLPSQKWLARRRWLSDSFNRGPQTLDEATVSARAMAESLERKDIITASGSNWIKGDGHGEIDMRQRGKAQQRILFEAVHSDHCEKDST
jgi:hypothetical protein